MGGGARERERKRSKEELKLISPLDGCSFIHARTLAWWWTFTKVSRTFMGADVRERERSCRAKRYEMGIRQKGLSSPSSSSRASLPRHRLGILMVRNWSSALERFNYVTLICSIQLSAVNRVFLLGGNTDECQVNLSGFLHALLYK